MNRRRSDHAARQSRRADVIYPAHVDAVHDDYFKSYLNPGESTSVRGGCFIDSGDPGGFSVHCFVGNCRWFHWEAT